jgi:copper(I)-binding protein
MNKLFAIGFTAVFLLVGCDRAPKPPQVQVERAWVRLPAAPAVPGAGYFEAKANGAGQALVGVSSPGLRIEMHESMTMNQMSAMRPIDSAEFAGERLAFAPGGKHLMIFGLDPKLKPGATLSLSLRFSSAPPVTVEAKLVGAGEAAPDHGD